MTSSRVGDDRDGSAWARPPRVRAQAIVLPGLLLLALGMAAIFGLLAFAAERQDRIAVDTAVRVVQSVIAGERRVLEVAAEDHAGWTGGITEQMTGQERAATDVFLFGPGGAVVAATHLGEPADPGRFAAFGPGARRLVGMATGAPGAVSGTLAAAFGGEAGGDALHLVAAADASEGHVPGAVLVLARRLDAAELAGIGAAFGFDGLRFVPAGPAPGGAPGRAALALVDPGGVPIGHLAWTPSAPGALMMERIVPPVVLVLAAMAVLAFVIVRRALGAAAAVERAAGLVAAAGRDLEESRRRLRDFAEAASDWFWETGPDHTYTYVSERPGARADGGLAAVFRWSLCDLGRLAEDDRAWQETAADIAAGRPFRDLVVTVPDGTGGPRVLRLSGRPVHDAAGRFLGYRGTGVDVTAETLAQKEARFLQALLCEALDSVSEGFVLFNPEGRLLLCNGRYRQAYPTIADILVPGVSFEEILRVAAERGGYEDARQDMGAWIEDRLRRHLTPGGPVDRCLSDGRWYRISEHATGSGGIVKILMDITELKLREEELAGQTARLKATLSSISQGICMVDAAGRLAAWNDDFARLLGVPEVLVVFGAPLAELVAHTGNPAVAAALDGARPDAPGGAADGADAVAGPGAPLAVGDRFLEVRRSRIPEGGFVATFTDVTARLRAEQELQRAQKMEAVGRMAGGVAHEFNNLLTAIGGFARLAERHPQETVRVLTCVREIAKASDRAAALTGQLLDFSRRTPGEETEVVRLAALLGDFRVFLKPLLGAGIEVVLEIRDTAVCAIANPVTLNQALLNLAINARDAMGEDGTLTVTLDSVAVDAGFLARHEGARPGRYAVLTVTDTGGGVPAELGDRIWEPFFTTKGPGKGTGLGLWMVYGTARQAGGAVEMDSVPGQGATFRVFLPAADPAPAADAHAATATLAEGETAAVLLVDDEEAVRSYLRLVLEEAGCTVTLAGDGVEALERFDEAGGLFDLVVSDLAMPRMNGPDLARALAERNPDLPILFLTGYASRDTARGLTTGPGRRLLMKPVGPDALITAVRALIAQ